MAQIAGEVPFYDLKSAKRQRLRAEARAVIGAAGAIASQDNDDPGITIAKNAGTGVYDLTFPKAVKGSLYFSFLSPAGTIKTAWPVTFSPTAGTAQVAFGNGGGTATNPASSDQIWFELNLDMEKDF